MTILPRDPLWFKDAIIYQVHVKAFFDTNQDGLGDLRGLIAKLDYLEELGITAIWLLPFYPSPLRDDGYDIADYFSVNPSYGTLADFQEFLAQAHRRGLRVITELVINHTSDQHAWFQAARRAPKGSPERDFYVWSDAPNRYLDARIIFKDFEPSNWTYDPVAQSYFWHRFYAHQPDLNFDNPAVHTAVLSVFDYWLEMGVDGLRLDAIPYLYEREGTNCENLPETHAFLKKLRAHVEEKYEGRMLLAEANQWPEDAAAYFGDGDECHMNFHFPLMPRLFMSLQMEDRFPIIDILDQTPKIPDNCQWATFLRNHDELTLEMVTDEERDYMYRMYAGDPRARINLGIRRRLAPLLRSRRKIELITTLLFSLPGTPIIYYGDEIGMGDNFYLGDRNGVRTPMQWSPDRNAGFSKCNPQQLFLPVIIDPEYHYEALNVENQESNLSSQLWWMRRVVSMRKQFTAFGRGSVEFLLPENGKVLAFLRRFQEQIILVVVNLSRFAQVVELDLAAFADFTPTEVFSQNKFPPIKAQPYVLTLAPHDHYWFTLTPASAVAPGVSDYVVPVFDTPATWSSLLEGDLRDLLEHTILPNYISRCRWFGNKTRVIRRCTLLEKITLGQSPAGAPLLLFELSYGDGGSDLYLLPLQFSSPKNAAPLPAEAIIARFGHGADELILHDGIHDERFRADLLRTIAHTSSQQGLAGAAAGFPGRALAALGEGNLPLTSRVLKVEQSNSSIIYGDKFFLKLYRKLEEGVNPDAEILRYLSEKQHFEAVPAFGGSLEYQRFRDQPRVLGLLLGMVPNEGDAWAYTLDSVSRFYERVLAAKPEAQSISKPLLFGAPESASSELTHLIGGIYPERARQLGQRTAQMHLALANEEIDTNFTPEPFTTLYQRSVYQSMRGLTRRTMQILQRHLSKLDEPLHQPALELLAAEPEILQRQARLLRAKINTTKTRLHGDYHLGQVLNTGKDFVIIDFEGEPSRSLSERKLKRSPLRDVAGMIRSFHYAAHSALAQQLPNVRAEDTPFLEPWAESWTVHISTIFLQSYLETARGASFVPADPDDLRTLIEAFLLEKAIYEVGYELNNRPAWLPIPMRGIREILREPETAGSP